jgi:hypothetical protein
MKFTKPIKGHVHAFVFGQIFHLKNLMKFSPKFTKLSWVYKYIFFPKNFPFFGKKTRKFVIKIN